MKRRLLLAFALLALALPAAADTTFHTETWAFISSNWQSVGASAATNNGYLLNDSSAPSGITQLMYTPALSSWDYSIQNTFVAASGDDNPVIYHYLRGGGYRV